MYVTYKVVIFYILFNAKNHVYHTSTHHVVLVRIECRSEMCCKNYAKNLCTIAQFCRAISSQLMHVSTIGKQELIRR